MKEDQAKMYKIMQNKTMANKNPSIKLNDLQKVSNISTKATSSSNSNKGDFNFKSVLK